MTQTVIGDLVLLYPFTTVEISSDAITPSTLSICTLDVPVLILLVYDTFWKYAYEL